MGVKQTCLLAVVTFFMLKGLLCATPEMPVTFYGNIVIDGNPIVTGEVSTVSVACGTNVLAVCEVDAQATFDYVLRVPFSGNSNNFNALHVGDIIEFYIDDSTEPVCRFDDANSSGDDVQLDLNVDYVSLIVEYPYGMQSGAITNTLLKGSWVDLSAPLVVVSGDGVRYECSGFSGGGSAPDSGGNAGVQLVLTNNTSVVWHWSETYQLQVSVNPELGGVVETTPSIDGVYFPAGTPVELVAEPTAGYLFGSWSGDCSGAASNDVVLMTGPKTVVADFLVDQNEDSIPDNWQIEHFGYIFADDAWPDADADLDGMTAYQEWISGTDPQDKESVFHLQELAVQRNNLTLSWKTEPERIYRVWTCRNMGDPWEPYPDEDTYTTGDGSVKTMSITNSSQSAFFKVEVWR